MIQYIELDEFDNVAGFVDAAEMPQRPGYRYLVQEPRVDSWPMAPFTRAQLRWSETAGLFWRDPRTTEEKAVDARATRDGLLDTSDKLVMPFLERALAVPAALLDYRQALRDLPSQPGFPEAIAWPTLPIGG